MEKHVINPRQQAPRTRSLLATRPRNSPSRSVDSRDVKSLASSSFACRIMSASISSSDIMSPPPPPPEPAAPPPFPRPPAPKIPPRSVPNSTAASAMVAAPKASRFISWRSSSSSSRSPYTPASCEGAHDKGQQHRHPAPTIAPGVQAWKEKDEKAGQLPHAQARGSVP